MPKVLIDLRMVRGPLHGIARYALELARRLPALAPDWSFAGLVGPAPLPEGLGALRPTLPLQRCAAPFLSPLEQPALLAALLRSRCDLFHATSFSLPGLWPGKLVATLHDANHLALPESSSPGRMAYYRLIVGPRAKAAKALLTVSEFSRDELARHLGLSPFKLQVISPGVDAAYRFASPSELAEFRARRGLPARYFAAVGNEKPHKNLKLLVKVVQALPAPLALVAGAGAASRLGLPRSVIDLGRLPEEEMPLFYGGATALLLPSRYEGFGLPALEAMACGCPVIAARAGALPEVLGEAGVLVDPDDGEAWIDAAQQVARDEQLRRKLMDKGRARSERFSWDECVQRTWVAYQRALGQ
ncbi:MAG: glycosyltransferase family 4 protein [Myxococcota bacterium]